MTKWLIRNARIINPPQYDAIGNIAVDSGKILSFGPNASLPGAREIHADGLIAAPGFVDIHVHLREPGQEHKETIETGTRAAAAGGFTTICCMPNTNPVIDNKSVVNFVKERAAVSAFCNVQVYGALHKGLEGKELAEIHEMAQNGICGVSDDGTGTASSEVMRRGMEYTRMFNLPLIAHCEERALSKDGVANEGYWSSVLGLKPIPWTSESIAVARNILLAEQTRCRLHICHVSCRRSVEIIRKAKEKGIAVTCEATPHHFTLDDSYLKSYDTNCKMNPPLRTKDDVQAILEGLADGTIDCIATDHAPHALEEKQVEFQYAPFGIIGLETALSLTLERLVAPSILTLPQALAKLTTEPARCIGLDCGTLREGGPADIVLFDPDRTWTLQESDIHSLSCNTPFIGRVMLGKVVFTLKSGTETHRDDAFWADRKLDLAAVV
jgi:dihydroorotase